MPALRIAAEKLRFPTPRQVTDDTSVMTLKTLVLEPLCRWHEGRARPGLFSAWRHDAAGRVWDFDIRPGATFHDGKACEAEDILAFIQGILVSVDTFGMPWSYARYLAGVSITATSRGSVRVVAPSPFADILDIFSEFFIARETPEGLPILGTGPYRVDSYTEGDRALLARVGPGDGTARIEILCHLAPEDRLAALRDGAVDVALNLERCPHRLDFEPRFDWLRATNTLSVMYFLNERHGPFTQPEARRAINLAVDVPAIIEDVFHGLGVASSTVVSPFHLGARAAGVAPYRHDPAAARRLFDQAGLAAPLVIRTPTFMPDRAPLITAAVADSLAAIGIPTRIDLEPDRPEYARQAGRKEIGDMAIFDSSPHSTFRILNDKISSAVKAVWWQGHDDPALESLISQANHAVADTAREAAYGACLARLHQNPPWLYLFHPVDVAGFRPGCAELALDARGVLTVRP
ncbi:ABC transporter substrate-binding protein [Humitalea sp. 24SJ18S-53]|uniref:ABC transporter substrate-binding protein n=1 Tax=Humitalea sp. 24SJ18S-53 TaxID=3422307 RepID=UPI003D67C580